MMSDLFDIFSSSKNEFKGEINFDSFKIKRRRRFFDTNMNFALAHGTFAKKNGQLRIETEINGFNNFFVVYYVFLILFYSLFIFIFAFTVKNGAGGFFAIPFITLHGTLMFSIPYIMIRRSVQRLKYELEREFFFLTKTK